MFCLRNHKFCKGKKQNKKCLWSPWAYKLDKAPVWTQVLIWQNDPETKGRKNFQKLFQTAHKINIFKQQGVCHIVTLSFTLKSVLCRKKNYGNSNSSPCKSSYNLQKNPQKEIKMLQDIIYLYSILGWCCRVVIVLLGGKGVRVSTPFIMNIFGLMI
jgi:hypothetical protein